MATDKSGASAPKSKREIAKEAQIELRDIMNEKRSEFFELYNEFKDLGGKEDIENAVLDLTSRFKPGIPLPFLQTVTPDVLLSKALKKLKAEGRIVQEGKKGNVIIRQAEDK